MNDRTSRPRWGMKTCLSALLVLACAFAALAFAAMSTAESPAGLKLYQVTSGTLTFDKGFLTAMRDVGTAVKIPVAMYIIEHPRGLVLFDTGNADDISDGNCEAYWGEPLCRLLLPDQTRDQVIDRWLEKFGYSVEQVKYVVYSHFHVDHVGNIELFPEATHVVQKRELRTAWWPEQWQRFSFVLKDFDEARDFKFMELTGDFDLFADGSLVVLETPGHTQGHQSLLVRLPNTGSLVLAGDAVYTPENEAGVIPGITWNTAASMESINRLKRIRDAEGGELWYSHDLGQYESHKHDAPYD